MTSETTPEEPRRLASGYPLFEHAVARDATAPWLAQTPGLAVERVLSPSEGWVRFSSTQISTPSAFPTDDVPPSSRVEGLLFYAFARPGQAVGLILDPYLSNRVGKGYQGRATRMIHWGSLRPHQRRTRLAKAFGTAIVSPSPVTLFIDIRYRCAHDTNSAERTIWRSRTASLLRDLLAYPDLDPVEGENLRTMAALGAYDA